jgi:hypothetical protein
MGNTAEEGTPASKKRPRESSRDRRWRSNDREEAQKQGQAYAVAAPMAASRPARSGRRPGAECTFCHKMDSHTEDECWKKNPQVKPDKWRKRDGEEPGTPLAVEMEQSGFTAWTAAVQTNCPKEAFAVFTDQGPELRPTTMAQRDTESAARAKGEAERQAARAKKDQVRLGGPPPGFRRRERGGPRRAHTPHRQRQRWAAGGDSQPQQRR